MKLILLAILALPVSVYASVTIIEDGIPKGVIAVQREAPDSVNFAALELQEHLQKISGARLDIVSEGDFENNVVIALGDTAYSKKAGIVSDELPHDGFILKEHDGILIISGRDYNGPVLGDRKGRTRHSYNKQLRINAHGETGTQFGVYRFLNELGVRWYMPGDIGTVIPDQKDIIFDGITITDNPEFTYRKLHGFSFEEDPEAAKWYKRIGYGSIKYININHNFTDWSQRFGKSHPEFFAVIDGRPHTETVKDEKRVVFNYTNEGMYKQVVDDVDEFFEEHPQEDIYPVVPNDSHVYHDEGKETTKLITKPAYSPGWLSDLVWGFVNDVAKSVYETYPDKYIASLSYAYQFDAPDQIERFSPNVVVMHCRSRLNTWDTIYKDYIDRTLDDFIKLKPAAHYVWEYYNLRAYDSRLRFLPTVAPHLIAEDIKNLKGVSEGEFIQAKQAKNSWKLDYPAYYHINLYVTAKALWDPDIDVDALLDEYMELYYGPSHQEMKTFWEKLEKIWVSQEGSSGLVDVMTPRKRAKHRKNRWKYYWKELYPPEVVDSLFVYLDKASDKVKDDQVFGKRIDALRSQFDMMKASSMRLSR